MRPSTFLVFGATGGTGRHFVSQALEEGHTVRALVRNPQKLATYTPKPNLQIHTGSITNIPNLDELVHGCDCIVTMLGDASAQTVSKVNTAFIKQLIPSMRRNNVTRLLYQAGGLSKPYNASLPPYLWFLRHTVALTYAGQHADNEAVMEYLGKEARDIEWIVHRAGIGSDGPSRGVLERSATSSGKYSVATFRDCAEYNLRVVEEREAVHTCCTSFYVGS